MIAYAANNLPYSALSGVITGDMGERNSLSSYRFIAVMAAQFIVQVFMLPLMLYIGDGDRAAGFSTTMTYLIIIGTIFLLITFWTTKERVIPTSEQESSVSQDVSDLIKNRPWIIMLVLTTLVFVTLALKGGMYIYYFKNYLSEPHIAEFLGKVGFTNFDDAAEYGFSLFNAGGIIFMIAGIMFSKPLADKYGKRDVFGVNLFLSTVFLIDRDHLPGRWIDCNY